MSATKIIGVEFRIGLRNSFGGRQREIFLHPLDILIPTEYSSFRCYPYFNVTVHTSHGDVNSQNTDLPVDVDYKNVAESDIKQAMELFEKRLEKY